MLASPEGQLAAGVMLVAELPDVLLVVLGELFVFAIPAEACQHCTP